VTRVETVTEITSETSVGPAGEQGPEARIVTDLGPILQNFILAEMFSGESISQYNKKKIIKN
jgi:hypothetical protein